MIKIKVFCSFAPSDKCKEVFERINYANEIDFYGKDKKYYNILLIFLSLL